MSRHTVQHAIKVAEILSRFGLRGATLGDAVIEILAVSPATNNDVLWNGDRIDGANVTKAQRDDLMAQAARLAIADPTFMDRKIQWIKALREVCPGVGLKLSKDIVDATWDQKNAARVSDEALARLREKLTGEPTPVDEPCTC